MVTIRPLRLTSSRCLSTRRTRFSLRSYSQEARHTPPVDNRASAKLFQDAAKEEAEEQSRAKSNVLTQLENQSQNRSGDEPIQDAVLRMLMDKYKPLRSGPIRTADEKLKDAPPKVGGSLDSTSFQGSEEGTLTSGSYTFSGSRRGINMANVPLLPSIEGHQPWHTTFKVPSHATSSIKYGDIPKPSTSSYSSSSKKTAGLSSLDEQARRKERELKKRTEQAGRLSRARESTLDYKLGMKGVGSGQRRPNPVSLKGWASLVEDRIEKARLEGQFRNIKGRGKPMQTLMEEKNPFIAREEFLMNRIVQRNGAAPPWVEIQGELESAVSTFREVIKQSWTRRAVRMLTITQPAALLPNLTLADVAALRDADWESREKAYHDSAIEELNSLVRKYNGLAPYAVRRPYYMRGAELERVYRECGEDILRNLAERVDGSQSHYSSGSMDSDDDEGPIRQSSDSDQDWTPLRIRDVIKQWVSSWRGTQDTPRRLG